jgi:hypothetical protein
VLAVVSHPSGLRAYQAGMRFVHADSHLWRIS